MIYLYLIVGLLSKDFFVHCFAFNNNYVEIWYLIPAEKVCSFLSADSLYKYNYRIIINSENGDSAIREGIKGIRIERSKMGNFVLDYFPIFLYPGRFGYEMAITLLSERLSASGTFEVISDTTPFYLSDLVLGSKTRCDTLFCRSGIKFTPKILPEYTDLDTLFSYVEIYGLVPDSLFYSVCYQIRDSLYQVIYQNEFRRLKYDYIQFDTISISLWDYREGTFKFVVEIFEPALNIRAQKEAAFHIKKALPGIDDKPFAWEIEYLVTDQEYKKFLKMNHADQIQYLKKFWARRNYKEFEKRLLEADRRFSTSFIKGRDTPMGRYYIKNGPPDEIRIGDSGVATRSDIYFKGAHVCDPQEVWIYETKGLEVIFKDINRDGVYELMGASKLGEQEKYDALENREELWHFIR
ncbi:MAG: GWxTD domain-containing protein [candidate division WOR-3 bacterium]